MSITQSDDVKKQIMDNDVITSISINIVLKSDRFEKLVSAHTYQQDRKSKSVDKSAKSFHDNTLYVLWSRMNRPHARQSTAQGLTRQFDKLPFKWPQSRKSNILTVTIINREDRDHGTLEERECSTYCVKWIGCESGQGND